MGCGPAPASMTVCVVLEGLVGVELEFHLEESPFK